MLEILISTPYAIILLIILDFYRRKSTFSIDRNSFLAYYFLKLAMGFGLTALYTFYYTDRATADIYKFFDDSAVIHQIAFTDIGTYFRLMIGLPIGTEAHDQILNTQHWDASAAWGGTGNRLMTRIHLFIRWISVGNVWVHSVFFSAFSVLGFMWIYRALSPYFRNALWIFLPFLMPSVLFWSSGMLKETVLIFLLGILFNAFYFFSNRNLLKGFVLATLATLFIFILKAYILIVMLPIVLAVIYWRILPPLRKQFFVSLVLGMLSGIVLINIASQIFLDRSFLDLLFARYNDFVDLAIRQNAGSLLLNTKFSLEHVWEWMLNGFKHTWLLPWPWNSGVLIKMAGLEHLCFLLLLVASVFILFKIKLDALQLRYFLLFLVFGVLLFQFIGLTIPVLGAIVRYKMPAIFSATLFFAFLLDKYFREKMDLE